MAQLALGKLPKPDDPRDLQLKKYIRPKMIPRPPRSFGEERSIGKHNWGMLGNNRVGDCVFAGAAHEHMLWTDGNVKFDEGVVLGDYSAVTGYAGTPETDYGTVVREAYQYRRNTGVQDSNGARHRIAAYASIDPKDWLTMLQALWLFDAIGIGFEVPAYLMTGIVPETWQVQESGDQEIIGGHYVPLVARRTTAKNVSWGRTYGITKPFLAKYCDEAWVPFSEEMLDHGGRSPEGFDRDELLRDLEALR
jgi:hypothetical protein